MYSSSHPLAYLCPVLTVFNNRLQSFADSSSEFTVAAIASIMKTISTGRNLHLDLAISEFSDDEFTHSMQAALQALTGLQAKSPTATETICQRSLPKLIRFPYARHSSYEELCRFVEAFKPYDIWPCTEDPQDWHQHSRFYIPF